MRRRAHAPAGVPGCSVQRLVQKIVVATSDVLLDDAIAEFCEHNGVAFSAATKPTCSTATIMRPKLMAPKGDPCVSPAICPLIDPESLTAWPALLKDGCDYASKRALWFALSRRARRRVFSFAALETAESDARRATDREHVTHLSAHVKKISFAQCRKRTRPRSMRHALDGRSSGRIWNSSARVYARLCGEAGIFGMGDVLARSTESRPCSANEPWDRA